VVVSFYQMKEKLNLPAGALGAIRHYRARQKELWLMYRHRETEMNIVMVDRARYALGDPRFKLGVYDLV
jgi:hypothetical protein